ncbi:D-galactarate dehydratase [Geobacillus sp. BCO2]|nr:D-galactarate dehydratase [Geobacillus sp. BCO2]
MQRIKKELLPKYPNVDDVVALEHHYGCGVAIHAPEAVIPIRTLQNLSTHPNFGGEVLVVGLGCEKLSPQSLNAKGEEDSLVVLQDYQGFADMIETIMRKAEERLKRLNETSTSGMSSFWVSGWTAMRRQ